MTDNLGEDVTLYVYMCNDCIEEEEKTEAQHKKLEAKIQERKGFPKDKTFKCPFCGLKEFQFSHKFKKIYSTSKNKIPRTVGVLAEQNYRKNKDKILEEKAKKEQEKWDWTREQSAKKGVELPKEKPKATDKMYGTKSVDELRKMTPEQQKRYVLEGE